MAYLTGTEASTGITNAVSDIMGVASTVLDTILDNPALSVFFFAGVIGIAIAVVKRLK